MHGPIEEVYRRIHRNRIVEDQVPREREEIGLSIIRSLPETRDVQVENGRVTVELDADDAKVADAPGAARAPKASACTPSPRKSRRWKTSSCWSPRVRWRREGNAEG